ncbi:MAG: hypothetical protein JO347_08670, partial [Candidatus Eremiobacteraeota bacterium]|nr:hypothetical protein [Candidatus Eremiobacteraeota bacterium]
AIAARGPDFIVECGASAVLAPMFRRVTGVDPERVVHVADGAGVEKLARLAREAA